MDLDDGSDDMIGKPNKRADDDGKIKIIREVPLHWAIGVIVLLIAQFVTNYNSTEQLKVDLKGLTVKIDELRTSAERGGLQAVKMEVKLEEHERRIQALESKK